MFVSKPHLNPKHVCQSAQEDSQAVIDCEEAQKKTKNKLQKKHTSGNTEKSKKKQVHTSKGHSHTM